MIDYVYKKILNDEGYKYYSARKGNLMFFVQIALAPFAIAACILWNVPEVAWIIGAITVIGISFYFILISDNPRAEKIFKFFTTPLRKENLSKRSLFIIRSIIIGILSGLIIYVGYAFFTSHATKGVMFITIILAFSIFSGVLTSFLKKREKKAREMQ